MMMYSLAVTQTAPELSANATAAPVPCRERQLWNATSCSLGEQLAHTRTTSHHQHHHHRRHHQFIHRDSTVHCDIKAQFFNTYQNLTGRVW